MMPNSDGPVPGYPIYLLAIALGLAGAACALAGLVAKVLP